MELNLEEYLKYTGDFALITKLDFIWKKLTVLPDISKCINLTELYCYENKLTQLPELPNSLRCLSFDDNQLTQLPKLPNSLGYLSCSLNKLTQLSNLPNSLVNLYCSYNQITEIPALPNIEFIYYYDNPIEYIHPITVRRIQRQSQNIYGDRQSVHNHFLQGEIKKAIKFLLMCQPFIGPLEEFMIDITDEAHTELNITYEELLRFVLTHVNTPDIYAILREEIHSGKGKCFTGRLSRIVNSLSGIHYHINISPSEQINAICAGSSSRTEATAKLKDLGYLPEDYEEFVSYIEE